MIGYCIICNKSFEKVRKNHLCCSKECNVRKQNLKKKEQVKIKNASLSERICKCRTCQNSFKPTSRKKNFCSKRCADLEGRYAWKDRNKNRYIQGERIRKNAKYEREPAYREDKKNRSNKNYHKKSRDEKRELSRLNRERQDPEKRKKYFRDYSKTRSQKDLKFKIANDLRSRVRSAIKNDSGVKSVKTIDLIGCSVKDLIKFLEDQFIKDMNWDNWKRDGWHIDHIRPCNSFNLRDENQQKVAFNWRNLKPIWGYENMSKNDQWNKRMENDWKENMKKLGWKGDLYLIYK